MRYSKCVFGSIAAAILMGQASGGFISDPKYPWVVEGIRLAYREGDITSYPSCSAFRSRGVSSRWEYAVALHAAETNRIQRLEDFLAKPVDDAERASLIRSLALLSFYRRADKEFRYELTRLGVPEEDRLVKVEPLTRQIIASGSMRHLLFNDVSFEHWAAKAVGDMRALGLLHGYPNDRFDGAK